MAAPMKPWESVPPCCRTPAAVNNRMVPPEEMRAANATVPQFQSTLGLGGGMVEPGSLGGAPPIPPRPSAGLGGYGSPGFSSAMSPYSGYGGYGAGYGTGYGAGYGTGYGGAYGGMGGMGAGYGGYGSTGGGFFGRPGALGPGPESWFIEAAEESSRSTFESIESFVGVFTSISQMMESTYMLVHSSFRAVVGVAEQMGRMRLHLAEVMSAISLVRTLRWILNFLRSWLGYPELGDADSAWSESAGAALPSSGPASGGGGSRPSRWPVLVYLLTVVGAPYLIFRLLRGAGGRPDNESWKSGAGEHFSAVCSYDFTAAGPGELSARSGQALRLAPRRLQPRVRGWVLASDGTSAGLLPAAYVKIRGAVPAGGAPGGPPAGTGVTPGAAAAAGVTPGAAAAAAGGMGPQPAPLLTAGPAGDSAPAVLKPAESGGEKKAGGGCGGGADGKQAANPTCPAPAPAPAPVAATAAVAAKPTCCGSKTAAAAPAPIHAPAAAPAAAPAPAPAPAALASDGDARVAALKQQVPANVTVVEVDPATVTVAALKAAVPSGPARDVV